MDDVRDFIHLTYEGLVPPDFIELFFPGLMMGTWYGDSIEKTLQRVSIYLDSKDVFASPSTRTTADGTKGAFSRSQVAWIDVDDPDVYQPCVLPPTMVIQSGTPGHMHVYWKLREPTKDPGQFGAALSKLVDVTNADRGSSDIVHKMRVPGSVNQKTGNLCRIDREASDFNRTYYLHEIKNVGEIGAHHRHYILTGELQYDGVEDCPSRSERDFRVMEALAELGYSERTIRQIFESHPVGDKFREEGDHYFEFTLGKVMKQLAEAGIAVSDDSHRLIVEGNIAGYFGLKPLVVVESLDDQYPPVARALVTTPTQERVIDFPVPDAFHDARTFRTELDVPDAVFIGGAKDVQSIQRMLTRPEVPRKEGIPYIGRASNLFIWPDGVISSDGIVDDADKIIVGSPYPLPLTFPTDQVDPKLMELLATYLPEINLKVCILPIMGWMFATYFKPILTDQYNLRFPILQIWGTRGSGKTQTVRLFEELLGFEEEFSKDANTTTFVKMALFATTNCIPIQISEYGHRSRPRDKEELVRELLLVYDGAGNARGRADLTVREFPYRSPIVITGEEPTSDPAFLERCIQVRLAKPVIQAGRPAWHAWKELEPLLGKMFFQRFAGAYMTWALNRRKLPVQDAEQLVGRTSIGFDLPDRVFNNFVVMTTGLLLIQQFFIENGFDILSTAEIQKIIPLAIRDMLGRMPTRLAQVDEFAEDLVFIYKSGKTKGMFIDHHPDWGPVLWFNLHIAHTEWDIMQARRGRSAISKPSIEQQIHERMLGKESEEDAYIITNTNETTSAMKGWKLFGIVLNRAHDLGLDVPMHLKNIKADAADRSGTTVERRRRN